MTWTIGQAAEEAGLSAKAVRLYEARGLIGRAPRTEGGYRSYTDEDLAVLRFIRQARSLGLSLQEIKQVLALQRGGAHPCSTVLGLLDHHIRDINATMRDLRQLRATLTAARDSTRITSAKGNAAVICRLIESNATVETPTRRRR